MPPINRPVSGGGGGGMEALGALLGAAPGGGPPTNGAAPGGMPPAGMGADAARQQLEAAMMRVRDLSEQVKLLMQEFPQAAGTLGQVQQLLKQAIIEMAPLAPPQTMSGAAVPGGGAPLG